MLRQKVPVQLVEILCEPAVIPATASRSADARRSGSYHLEIVAIRKSGNGASAASDTRTRRMRCRPGSGRYWRSRACANPVPDGHAQVFLEPDGIHNASGTCRSVVANDRDRRV